jgi:hypothetical protein
MARDLAMIFSVMLSVVSVGFGLYKNIEAGNARGFAYEQAYRIMGIVQQANIGANAKASILDQAMDTLATPPPVLDLSRSSADQPVAEACTDVQRASCEALASQLADTNVACAEAKDAECVSALDLKHRILDQGCFACY